MDPSQVERLKQKQRESLQLCEEKIKQWEKFRSDYEILKQQLESLPNALSYDITVPFGPNAFTMGKLVHTNEVMVLLGDNWFAEVSGKQAAEIADRRISQCNKMLDDLAKEKQQFENWLNYINEVCNDDLVEIVEEYDEEKEKEWRIQHSKNVKAYHRKLAGELRPNHDGEENITDINSEDDYITKLEKLELMETLEDRELSASGEDDDEVLHIKEFSESEGNDSEVSHSKEMSESEGNDSKVSHSKEMSESEGNDSEVSHSKEMSESEGNDSEIAPLKELSESERNDDKISPMKKLYESGVNGYEALTSKELSDSFTDVSRSDDSEHQVHEEKSSKPSLRLNINCSNDQSSVHETESGDDEDGSKSDDINENLENCNSGSSQEKHVRWQDLTKQRIKKITFKHSKSKLHTHTHHTKYQMKRQDSSESDEPHPLIQSPSDIYKHFGSFFQASSPKSILKVKNSPSTTPDGNEIFFPVDDIVPNDSSPDVGSESIMNAFTGKVFERSSPIHIPEKKCSSRPSSHFKNSRKNRRR